MDGHWHAGRDLQAPVQGPPHGLSRQIEEALLAQEASKVRMVGGRLAPAAGGEQGPYQPAQHVGLAIGKAGVHAQHLFRHPAENLRPHGDDAAHIGLHCHLAPGRTHAEAVDQPVAQALGGEGRGHHHHPHVLVRIDAAGLEEAPQEVGVGGEGIDRGEDERVEPLRLAPVHHRAQRLRPAEGAREVQARFGHGVVDVPGDGDGAAVEVQRERHHQGYPHMAEPERGGDGERAQHVSAIQHADIHLVADVGPGDFLVELDLDAFGGGEAALGGGD